MHERGQITRAELTNELGLNRSTIGALTAELAEAGLVTEEAPRETGRAGRPSLVVRANSESIYVYAVSIEVDQVRVARVGLGGAFLDRTSFPRPADVVGAIASAVHSFEADPAARCVGLGVAIPGLVRREDRMVRHGPHLGMRDEPLGDLLQEKLSDLQISVGNVADVCALAEHTRGVAIGCSNVIYIYGDVGVGAGIIASGHRVAGHGGYGGEVGHMVVNPNGEHCECGARGCWETEVGELALLRLAESKVYGQEGILSVIDRAARGDHVAQAAIRHVGDWLGFGVANLVNIFNPELVIFGGTMRDIYLASAAQVRSRLNSNGLPATREHVRLRTPALGAEAAMLGAADLAFEPLLTDPLWA